jgi:hypothetical protein
MVKQTLAQRNASHLNAYFTQDPFGFDQDLIDPLIGENF